MNVQEAAAYLGIARKTLYKWKRQARRNNGYLIFHGKAARFRYRQTGAIGQRRILFERQWLDELKRAMEGVSSPTETCSPTALKYPRRTRSSSRIDPLAGSILTALSALQRAEGFFLLGHEVVVLVFNNPATLPLSFWRCSSAARNGACLWR